MIVGGGGEGEGAEGGREGSLAIKTYNRTLRYETGLLLMTLILI